MKKELPITKHFESITDNRIKGKIKHKLIDIIAITICAVIGGADEWTHIEEYAKSKEEWLKRFLELPNGIPSHDTFGRIFAVINAEEFSKSFLEWVRTVFKVTDRQVIPIDGKTLRRSYDSSSNKAAIHMVSAWASKNGIVLGQVKTNEKSNEITAIPELLNLLEIKKCIITIDAMGCQKEIAKRIIEKEADYVLAVKGNQGRLHEDIKLFFEDGLKKDFYGIEVKYYEETEGDHGRVETRRYWTTEEINWLSQRHKWEKIKIIGMVESERTLVNKTSIDRRYYISSIENDVKEFAEAVRKHWQVENSLHWILDVAFREDDSRVRKGNASENLSIVRRIALNLLKQEKTVKVGVKGKRMRAGWDNNYLLKVLNA